MRSVKAFFACGRYNVMRMIEVGVGDDAGTWESLMCWNGREEYEAGRSGSCSISTTYLSEIE